MKINIGNVITEEQRKDLFVFEVKTMEGDADDYHEFEMFANKDELKKVKKLIRYLKVLEKSYPNGKGGCDGFDELDFFEEWFEDDWYSYEGIIDSFESWKLFFYDENGIKHSVSYELSQKDRDKIDSYPAITY